MGSQRMQRLAAIFALLALTGWLWASIQALDHHHTLDEGSDCPTCELAALPGATLHVAAVATLVPVDAWHASTPAPFLHARTLLRASARGPPAPTSTLAS